MASRALFLTAALTALMTITARPAAADEEGPKPTGLRLGARTGFAVPGGDTFRDSGALSDTITGQVPVRVDLGARIARHFYVGALLQLGLVASNNCASDTQCSGTDVRFGAMIAYHVLPERLIDPWIGAGIGYEILSVKRSSTENEGVRLTASGFELFDLELGADVRVTSSLRIGPVVSGSLARFTSITVNGKTTSDFETALHGWTMLGIRGAFDL